jgi:murein DD-endopeptidase MepM/ murein hydrolase activator NlpD
MAGGPALPRTRRRARCLPALALCGAACLQPACSLPRWPAEGRITSPYGLRLSDSRPAVHRGVDIAMPTGTPVHAMARGTVHFAGELRGYGLTVILEHRASVRSLYAHLSDIQVTTGERVRAGQPIALSGMSGNASGPHLHFEISRRGRVDDPVVLLGRQP